MQKYRIHLFVPVRFAVDVEAETPIDAIEEAIDRFYKYAPFDSLTGIDQGAPFESEVNDPVSEALVDPYVDGERDIDASTDYRWDLETNLWEAVVYP